MRFIKKQWLSLLMFFCFTTLGFSTAVNTDKVVLAASLTFVGGLYLSSALYGYLLDKAITLLKNYHAVIDDTLAQMKKRK